MVLSMPSFLFKLLLSTCKTVLRISFLSILIFFFNLQDGSLCFFSLRIFFLRCRWQDGRYHLSDMLLLYLPWKYHLLVVLHRAFCGFNHDTSGWFSTYFHGMKRCTDASSTTAVPCYFERLDAFCFLLSFLPADISPRKKQKKLQARLFVSPVGANAEERFLFPPRTPICCRCWRFGSV